MERPQVTDGGTASRYEEELQIHLISSPGQPTKGSSRTWELGEVLRNPHLTNLPCYKTFHNASNSSFGTY